MTQTKADIEYLVRNMHILVHKYLAKQKEEEEKKFHQSSYKNLLNDFEKILDVKDCESEDDHDKFDVSDVQIKRDGQIINFG